MKKSVKYVCIAALAPLLIFARLSYVHRHDGTTLGTGADSLVLLVPDGVDFSMPAVREWLDATAKSEPGSQRSAEKGWTPPDAAAASISNGSFGMTPAGQNWAIDARKSPQGH